MTDLATIGSSAAAVRSRADRSAWRARAESCSGRIGIELRSMVGRSESGRSARDLRSAPRASIGAGCDRALRDQLGLGLLDQGIFVDASEDRAEARKGGDEQKGSEQDGAQAKRGPEALEEVLDRSDQAVSPLHAPIR